MSRGRPTIAMCTTRQCLHDAEQWLMGLWACMAHGAVGLQAALSTLPDRATTAQPRDELNRLEVTACSPAR